MDGVQRPNFVGGIVRVDKLVASCHSPCIDLTRSRKMGGGKVSSTKPHRCSTSDLARYKNTTGICPRWRNASPSDVASKP